MASPPSAGVTASGRDPSGTVPGSAWPQPMQRVGEGAGQAGGVGEIRQQTGPGMADHFTPSAETTRRDCAQ
jgi:hypothetical protein